MPLDPSETERLLPTDSEQSRRPYSRRRASSNVGLLALFSVGVFVLIWLVTFRGFRSPWTPYYADKKLPSDPLARAKALLELHPLIDGHIDLPIQARLKYSNKLADIDLENPIKHVSIPKLREGRVGGFFWSAYIPCAADAKQDEGVNYTNGTWRVRDTLEQIDISKLLMQKYSKTFQLTTSANGIRGAFRQGKIAGLIGIEGAHQLGNSIAVMRQYYDLGVRYVTLTHTCNNAFAGSCGFQGRPIEKLGLTPFGLRLVHEMNRIGMIVDISHTSSETAAAVLKHSKAPVIFSHSNARGVWNVPRNVEDGNLKEVKRTGSLVMATFAPQFVSQSEQGEGTKATLENVADHIEYIASIAGKEHVGIGSDFDGIFSTPVGLEDVSKYPHLMAELIRRGWKDSEIIGLAGGNFIRTFEKIEAVAAASVDQVPESALYEKRPDLPWHWEP